MLRNAGLPVIDCDQLAHDLQKQASNLINACISALPSYRGGGGTAERLLHLAPASCALMERLTGTRGHVCPTTHTARLNTGLHWVS